MRFRRHLLVCLLSVGLVSGCVSAEKKFQEEEARFKKVQAYHEIGVGFLKKEQPGRALTNLLEALKLEPDNPWVNNTTAQAYLQLRRFEDAARCWEHALKYRKDLHPARQDLAGVYLQFLNRYDDVILHTQVLIDDPTYVHPWIAMDYQGLAYQRLGRQEEARAAFTRVLKTKAYWPAALHLGVLEEQQQNYQKALKLYAKSLTLEDPAPNDYAVSEIHYRMGNVHVALGDESKARRHFTKSSQSPEENLWSARSKKSLKGLR